MVLIALLSLSIRGSVQRNNLQAKEIDSLLLVTEKMDSIEKHFSDFLPLGEPLDTIDISSEFGGRHDPDDGHWEFHEGLDLRGIWTDTVYATGSGTIKLSGGCGGYGRCVVINHIGGYGSRYAHLYKIFVKKGTFVTKGQPIGLVGNSGHATGYHLHYEVFKDSLYLDPLKWMTLMEDGKL